MFYQFLYKTVHFHDSFYLELNYLKMQIEAPSSNQNILEKENCDYVFTETKMKDH